jgi:hypothetical protein
VCQQRGDIALRRRATAETRRKFDRDFKEGAVRLVREIGKPVAQVAKDLGINPGTLANPDTALKLPRNRRPWRSLVDERGYVVARAC